MKRLIDYIPKKYKTYVSDFHKESDPASYWLSLKQDGKYYLQGYYSEYTIHEDTIQDVLKVLRQHIKIRLIPEAPSEKETCKNCTGYQQEELSAGLLSTCITDELYEDEDCQVIKEDINSIVMAFMHGKIEKCPYFKAIDVR